MSAGPTCASHLPLAPPQRWDAHRKAAALAHWRRLLAERREAEENLKRCLIRKRVAFRLFRHWYWESFDDDMQVRSNGWGAILKLAWGWLAWSSGQDLHEGKLC